MTTMNFTSYVGIQMEFILTRWQGTHVYTSDIFAKLTKERTTEGHTSCVIESSIQQLSSFFPFPRQLLQLLQTPVSVPSVFLQSIPNMFGYQRKRKSFWKGGINQEWMYVMIFLGMDFLSFGNTHLSGNNNLIFGSKSLHILLVFSHINLQTNQNESIETKHNKQQQTLPLSQPRLQEHQDNDE
jgi:hypothetical protein